MRVIMIRYTLYPNIPTSLRSTESWKRSLRARAHRWCKNSRSGLQPLPVVSVDFLNCDHIHCIQEIYSSGKHIGAVDFLRDVRLWRVLAHGSFRLENWTRFTIYGSLQTSKNERQGENGHGISRVGQRPFTKLFHWSRPWRVASSSRCHGVLWARCIQTFFFYSCLEVPSMLLWLLD